VSTAPAQPDGTAVVNLGLAELIGDRSVVVCCGSGGAGKTTVSAAIAVAGAEAGRKACVVTIDPARRLADALGLEHLENTPKRIDGPWPGELHAVMLDAKGTFDDLIARYAESPEQAERILSNRLYRNLTNGLSGTQEYMAMEKLYELHTEGGFDLVVVDTPPTRHALDFLEAPRRLYRFLENRVFRIILMPTRAYLKAMAVATQALLRTMSRIAGSELVEDAVAFFRAFEGMEEGFRERARRVEQLLEDPGTAFILVAAPRRDSVDEAGYFSERLAKNNISVAGLVVNRLHPTFTPGNAVPPPVPLSGPLAGAGHRGADNDPYGDLHRNLADFVQIAQREEGYFSELAGKVEPAPVVRVPFLPEDVHDLEGLEIVARYLLGAK
jgi:anion-transporting  ArsA/GET3 family ATPase